MSRAGSLPKASFHREVEAKFLVRSRALHDAVAALKSLGEFRVMSRRREKQSNTYFDTDDLALKKSRSVLKLRLTDRKREVTFKSEMGHRRGVSDRRELTLPIRKSQVGRFLKELLDIEPVRCARAVAERKPLKKLFTLFTDRRITILGVGRQRVELDVDRVVVRQGRKRLEHREVELENLTASPKTFRRAIAVLRRRFGARLRPSQIWKAEYGYRMASSVARDTPYTPHGRD